MFEFLHTSYQIASKLCALKTFTINSFLYFVYDWGYQIPNCTTREDVEKVMISSIDSGSITITSEISFDIIVYFNYEDNKIIINKCEIEM